MKHLCDSLAFNGDQTQLIEELVCQSMQYVQRTQHDSSSTLALVPSIPATLGALPSVSSAAQVISVAEPLILRRMFEAMVNQNVRSDMDADSIMDIRRCKPSYRRRYELMFAT